MIILILLVVGLGIYEVTQLLKKKYKREAIIWICMGLITIVFGIYYMSNPFENSLSNILLSIFGLDY